MALRKDSVDGRKRTNVVRPKGYQRVARPGAGSVGSVHRLPTAAPPLDAPTLLADLPAAAERYVNKAPKQQRLAADRQALLDVLTRVQLFLSVEDTSHKRS